MEARVRAVAAHLGAGPDQHDELRDALARLDDTQRAIVWLDAYERSRHDPLLAGLAGTAQPVQPPPTELAAHVVCCIDVRSEGLRRHLEATGPYETYGYAGFFGLPLRFEPLSGGNVLTFCHTSCNAPTQYAHLPLQLAQTRFLCVVGN